MIASASAPQRAPERPPQPPPPPPRPRGLGVPATASAFAPIEVFSSAAEVAVCMARGGFTVTRVDACGVAASVAVGRVASARTVSVEVTLEAPRVGGACRLFAVASGGDAVTRGDELAARRMLSAALDLGGLFEPAPGALREVAALRRACSPLGPVTVAGALRHAGSPQRASA